MKVIGRLPGERSCLSLVRAVLDRASRGWRGVQQTSPSIRPLAELRRELFEPIPIEADDEASTETVTAAAQHHDEEPASVTSYSKSGTQPAG